MNNRRPTNVTNTSQGIMIRLWKAALRWIKVKWSSAKNFFRYNSTNKMVVALTLTDETDTEEVDNNSVLTGVALSVKITSPDELEWVQREFKAYFRSTRLTRDELLNHLIQLHYRFGVELEQIYQKADRADIVASSLGLFSTILGIAGFGLAFTTLGSSLVLSLSGLVIGIVSGATTFAVHRIRTNAKRKMWKQIREQSEAFNRENEKLLHILSEAEYLGILSSGGSAFVKSPVQTILKSIDLNNAVDFYELGSTASRISNPLVKGLTTGGEVLFYGGFALSLVSAAVDTYTIVDRSKRLMSGEWCQQAKAHRDMAQVYEEFRDSGRSLQERTL